MSELKDLEIMKTEWEAWQKVVKQLKATGAVTEEDCSRKLSDLSTPGAKLFEAIRTWGDLLVELRMQIPKR